MANAIFPEGVRVFNPKPSAPEYIKLNLLLKPSELIPWLQKHAKNDELRLDLKASQNGKLYLQLNTYQKPQRDEDDGTRGLNLDEPPQAEQGQGIPF